MVISLERGADLHMAQLMPLPLTVSCFSKIQFVFTFLVPAHLGSPGKRAIKRVCVHNDLKRWKTLSTVKQHENTSSTDSELPHFWTASQSGESAFHAKFSRMVSSICPPSTVNAHFFLKLT